MIPKRSAVTALALVAAALTLPGCLVAVGSSGGGGSAKRVKDLEERIVQAEQRLGIPSPEVNQ